VNYLSHFFIDNQPGRYYYNAALILPDITRAWVKKIEPSFIPAEADRVQQEILQGCLQHYQSDKKFHTSPFFEHYQNLINRYLKQTPLSDDVNRKWFIAHVLTELLIDRQIVKLSPEVVDDFYFSLSEISDVELDRFLTFCGMGDSTDFFTFLNHFRKARYIYYYADNNKFLYSLGRIMMRVGMPELSEQDGRILLEAILSIEQRYMSNPLALLDELRTVFN
jgi:hypothetical protein